MDTRGDFLIAAKCLEIWSVHIQRGLARQRRQERAIRVAKGLEWQWLQRRLELTGMADCPGVAAVLVTTAMIEVIMRIDDMCDFIRPQAQQLELCRQRLIASLRGRRHVRAEGLLIYLQIE